MRRVLSLLPCLALLAACSSDAGGPAAPEPEPPATDLAAVLEATRAQAGLPGLAAAVVRDGVIVESAVVGYRRAGSGNEAEPDDRWHVGSITKSMTATLAALLVEDGLLDWDATLGEVLPELAAAARAEYRDATLEQMLAHRAGFPALTAGAEISAALLDSLRTHPGTTAEQRRFLAERMLRRDPPVTPGEAFLYSNLGYVVAGLMLETVAGEGWETLITRRVFEPLGLASAGFGPPATAAAPDQPWGHYLGASGLVAVPPGPNADNPPVFGPAGTVHLSIEDLAAWAAFHVAAARGESPLVSRTLAQTLHTPRTPSSGYGLGIVAVERPWAGDGPALAHAGSNGMFFAVMWAAPARDFAVVLASNVGADVAGGPLDLLACRLIRDHIGGCNP